MTHLTPEQLTDFSRGELSASADALAHAHLAECARCRAEYDAEIALGEALRSAALAEELPLPAHVKAVVWERVRELPRSPVTRLSLWLQPFVAVPVAAALVLGAWFASPYGPQHGPTVTAAYYLQAHAAQSNTSLLAEPIGPHLLETSLVNTGEAMPATLAEAVDVIR